MSQPVMLNRKSHRFQRGVSLIELMIAITLGLIIVAALSTLFVSQSRARAELDKSNQMIDNGRYAMSVISSSLRVAGFFDTYIPTGVPTASPDPCNLTDLVDPSKNLNDLRHHVQGYNASTGPTGVINTAALPASCNFTYTAGSATSLKQGSDILVLRRASTLAPVTVANGKAIYFQTTKCVSDSLQYQISKTLNSAIHDKDCAAVASLRPFVIQVYFVSPDNVVGDGIPTLKRLEFDTATGGFVTTSLVEGIEYMRIDYGIDTGSDGAPDEFKAAPALTEWPNVTAVQVNLLARNGEETVGYKDTKSYSLGLAGTYPAKNDKYKRHAFTQMVRLVNPSGRREAP